jgi:predicted Zn-dependent peptidase
MKFSKPFQKAVIACVIAIIVGSSIDAQTVAKPRQEMLINGLKVLIWNQPSETVTVTLRVHAGSSFDPQGKEGTMKMLAEAIFPSDDARQFDDLGGNLEIVSNYDYIQLTSTVRKGDAYVNLIETLATAVANPQLDKETTDQVRIRVNAEGDQIGTPAYLADRIASERLFGTFPYGRAAIGTTESRAKIDFADLRFAYSRFFGADNATLAIRGPVDSDLAYRAARRYFGAWLKSDNKVPSTFKQPETPDTSLHVLNLQSDQGAEVRHAIRGFAKADTDFAVSEVLTRVLDARLKRKATIDANAKAEVRNEAHILPGQIVFAVSRISTDAKIKLYPPGESVDPKGLINALLSEAITDAEFQTAKTSVLSATNALPLEAAWLDSDTYKITPAVSQVRKIEAVTLADVQKLAASLKTRPSVNLWLVKGIGAK